MFINFDIFKRWLFAYIAGVAQAFGAAVTFATTIAVTGAASLTGGIAQAVAYNGVHNALPAAATTGTDTFFADGTHFLSSIWVPANITVGYIRYLIGTVGGTDKVYGVIYDASGAVVAYSSLTTGGATVGTAANVQALALATPAATVALVGPRMYFVGISANGGTAKLRTIPAHCGGSIFCGSVAQVHGTVAAVAVPTAFAADKAPYISLG